MEDNKIRNKTKKKFKHRYVDVLRARRGGSRRTKLFVGVEYSVIVEVNPTTNNDDTSSRTKMIDQAAL